MNEASLSAGVKVLVVLGMVVVTQTVHAGIRVFGSSGLSQVTPADGDWKPLSEESLTGYDVQLVGQIDVLSPIPLFSVFVGPNMLLGQTVREYKKLVSVTVNGQVAGKQETTIKETLDSKLAGVEVGAQFNLVSIAQLQAAAHYNVDLSNGYKIEAPVSSVTANKEYSLDSGDAFGFTFRGLITPFPLLRVGVEYDMTSGSRKYKDEASDFKFDSWSARALLGLSF